MLRAPDIVPPARGNFAAREFVTVVLKFASSPSADANSFKVFSAPGAESITALICTVISSTIVLRAPAVTLRAMISPAGWVLAAVPSWARTTVRVLPLRAVTLTISTLSGGESNVAKKKSPEPSVGNSDPSATVIVVAVLLMPLLKVVLARFENLIPIRSLTRFY